MKKRLFTVFLFLIIVFADRIVLAEVIKEFYINQNAIWSGEIIVPETVTVEKNVILTITPGSVLKFTNSDAGLKIKGSLIANGSFGQKINFTSENGKWQGIEICGDLRGDNAEFSQLSNCRISAAETGIKYFQGVRGEIQNCIFERNGLALLITNESNIIIKNNDFQDNLEGGIVFEEVKGSVINCRFVNNKDFAVICGRRSSVVIEDNLVEGHTSGIYSFLLGTEVTIKNNIFRKNQFGITSERFANSVIFNNTFQDNEYGIKLSYSANARIYMNEISRNRIGIFFEKIFVSALNDNNIYLNADYEVSLKQVAGELAKKIIEGKVDNGELMNIVSEVREAFANNKELSFEYIDGRRNFWGEALTSEMKNKGEKANISKIQDFYDNPTAVEGSITYREDYLLYSEWKDKPIEGAGAVLKPSYGISKDLNIDLNPYDTNNQAVSIPKE